MKSAQAIRNPRIVKAEQVSKSRRHCEVKLTSPAEIDSEFLNWVRPAYELCA